MALMALSAQNALIALIALNALNALTFFSPRPSTLFFFECADRVNEPRGPLECAGIAERRRRFEIARNAGKFLEAPNTYDAPNPAKTAARPASTL